jgi:hypothetical protein
MEDMATSKRRALIWTIYPVSWSYYVK